MSASTHRHAIAIVATLLASIGDVSAHEIHPEDAACRLPCEVHDAPRAPSRPVAAASAPTAVKRDASRDVSVAQANSGAVDAKREPALAHERVAR